MIAKATCNRGYNSNSHQPWERILEPCQGIRKGVLAIKQGDNVYGQAAVISGRSGVFSRAISANAESIAHKPKSLSYTEPAALPIGAMRAISYSSHNR